MELENILITHESKKGIVADTIVLSFVMQDYMKGLYPTSVLSRHTNEYIENYKVSDRELLSNVANIRSYVYNYKK